MISLFIIGTLICLFFSSFLITKIFKLNQIFLYLPLLFFLAVIYCTTLITRQIGFSLIVFYLLLFISCFLGILIFVRLKKVRRSYIYTELKQVLIIAGASCIIYVFANYYLPEFVSLIPYSDTANQIANAQNIYFGYELINIDRNLNALSIMVGYILKLNPYLNEILISVIYCNLLIYLFIFFVVEVIIKVWISNNDNCPIANVGVIIFVGLIFTLASLRLSYLSYYWAIFPIIMICYVLKFDYRLTLNKVICLIVLFLSIFCLGLNFRLSIFISGILLLLVVSKIFTIKYNLISPQVLAILILIILSGSYLFYVASGNSIYSYINSIALPTAQNLFNPVFDISTSVWILNIFVLFNIINMVIKAKRDFSSDLIIVLLLFFICFNPCIFEFFEDVENFQIILFLLFNPVMLSVIFENIKTNRGYNNMIVSVCCLVMVVTSNKFLINPYYVGETSNFDKTVRIEKQELEIYNFFNSLRNSSTFKIVSQAPFTKAFLPGAVLLEPYEAMINRCQYCDVDSMHLHEPNELINIFNIREYSGNRIFIEYPQYDKAKELLIDNNYRYLILRKDQIVEVSNNWVSLADLVQPEYKILYQNETYTLLTLND